jgi:CheY-like chemotaxis protein
VTLAVRYGGCALDDAAQDRILFEPFTATTAPTGGARWQETTVTGLVTGLGGRIEVERVPVRGTTFRIFLPRNKHRPRAVAWRETILLVEDEPLVRSVAREMLRCLGYRVLEAADSREALRICREQKHRIHLMLSDVVMPGMNGPELAEHVVSLTQGIRVLFMSGFTCGVIGGSVGRDPGLPFLNKPFSFSDLDRKVSEVLA